MDPGLRPTCHIAASKMADLLDLPCFIINMDRNPVRLAYTMERARAAGFTNVQRFPAVDARDSAALAREWARHGNPEFHAGDPHFRTLISKQGVALSHYNVWRHVIENDIPRAVVFEDDILFHKDWAFLAPLYWQHTPTDYDILFIGTQPTSYIPRGTHIIPSVSYCLHAYVITKPGAQRLYDTCLNFPGGTFTIDVLLANVMAHALHTQGLEMPFIWYCWISQGLFPDPRASMGPYADRNHGLVFQDDMFDSLNEGRPVTQDIRPTVVQATT